MSNLSKLVVAIAACGGLLMSLRSVTPHASSVVAATLTGSHSLSSGGTEDARPAVAPVIGIESNTTDVFGTRMFHPIMWKADFPSTRRQDS